MNINKIIQTIFSPAIFLLILFLASLLRFLWLDSIPSGFEHDEAANGYAAYSLALTQRDEYGTFLPLYLKSVGDYRSSFYALTIIPFIKMAGLNELSVRLPAAIAGILTVVIVYYLVQEIFNNKNLACLTAFLLAISPWHIIISRLGFDAIYFPWIF
ncbi:MAG: phospholipid carrier-dependent glycosyltransferase, partial [Cyanobacteria bacterium J083]